MNQNYKEKYLKYKAKYLRAKVQHGGTVQETIIRLLDGDRASLIRAEYVFDREIANTAEPIPFDLQIIYDKAIQKNAGSIPRKIVNIVLSNAESSTDKSSFPIYSDQLKMDVLSEASSFRDIVSFNKVADVLDMANMKTDMLIRLLVTNCNSSDGKYEKIHDIIMSRFMSDDDFPYSKLLEAVTNIIDAKPSNRPDAGMELLQYVKPGMTDPKACGDFLFYLAFNRPDLLSTIVTSFIDIVSCASSEKLSINKVLNVLVDTDPDSAYQMLDRIPSVGKYTITRGNNYYAKFLDYARKFDMLTYNYLSRTTDISFDLGEIYKHEIKRMIDKLRQFIREGNIEMISDTKREIHEMINGNVPTRI